MYAEVPKNIIDNLGIPKMILEMPKNKISL
jgi:hypothetical protein